VFIVSYCIITRGEGAPLVHVAGAALISSENDTMPLEDKNVQPYSSTKHQGDV
jgi:hypothetical protein